MSKRNADVRIGYRTAEEALRLSGYSASHAALLIGCSHKLVYSWAEGNAPHPHFYAAAPGTGCRCDLYSFRAEGFGCMTLSPIVAEWAEAYKQEHGHKPADMSLQIAEHILKVGKMLTNLGQKDAQEVKTPYPADVFPALVLKAFRMDVDEDHETVQAVADLWQSNYMDGYNDT